MNHTTRFVAVTLLLALPNLARAQGLEPLAYTPPGLVVDLGVGLWAWPVPCDAAGDADFDLVVSCPDKPSNGVELFQNTSGDTAKNKLPVFKPARLRDHTGVASRSRPTYWPGTSRTTGAPRTPCVGRWTCRSGKTTSRAEAGRS
jgi:hypothetical protein